MDVQNDATPVRIEAQEIPQRDSFRGSIISMDREIREDVKNRTRAGWLNWRLAFIVLCDQCMPTRLKGNFMRVIRPVMT